MEKSAIFKRELAYINDENIRKSCEVMLELLPDYYFTIAASSTGKYHPEYATGEHGLIRHVKAAVRVAKELFEIYKFDSETKDLVLMALILHDGLKKGLPEEKYTRFDHPLLIGDYIKRNGDKLFLNEKQIDRIIKMDASHMGRWNTSAYESTVLPLPQTPEEKLVHMCDYLASRKCIHFDFDEENNIID